MTRGFGVRRCLTFVARKAPNAATSRQHRLASSRAAGPVRVAHLLDALGTSCRSRPSPRVQPARRHCWWRARIQLDGDRNQGPLPASGGGIYRGAVEHTSSRETGVLSAGWSLGALATSYYRIRKRLPTCVARISRVFPPRRCQPPRSTHSRAQRRQRALVAETALRQPWSHRGEQPSSASTQRRRR